MVAILFFILGLGADPATMPADSATPATQPVDMTTSNSAVSAATARELDEYLRLVVGNNTADARELGARSLLKIGTDEASRRLVDVLKGSSDAAAKLAVCRALLIADPPPPMLLDAVIPLLGREPPELAQQIPGVLRRYGAQVVIPKLNAIAAATNAPIEQRTAAINALGILGDDVDAVEVLMDLLQNGGTAVSAAVNEALSDISGLKFTDVAAAVAWWEAHRRMDAIEWLRDVNQRRKEELRRMRQDREMLVARLVAASRESYSLTPEPEQPRKLLAFLRDDTLAVKLLALDLINGLITDRKEIGQEIRAQVLKLVSEPSSPIRRRAAAIVGDLRPVGAAEVIRNLLPNEPDAAVRVALVNALGRLDNAEVIPTLVSSLSDESQQVVGEAASALGLLLRKGGTNQPATDSVIPAILSRFNAVGKTEDELREKFLEAMGRIGADSFRDIFKEEMKPDRSPRVRSAAISSYSKYADSAGEIRKYCTAAEPEVRLSVVQALGRCGVGREDLDGLNICLDSAQEPNPSVRERAWESYVSITKRMSVKDQLAMAARFDRPGDVVAQRRRADLLIALRVDSERAEPLTSEQKLSLLNALADAQYQLREFLAAAATVDDAMALTSELSPEQLADLRARSMESFLQAGQDETAVERLRQYSGDSGSAVLNARLAESVTAEIENRLQNADLPAEFINLLGLTKLAEPVIAAASPAHLERLRELEGQAVEARGAIVDRLLDSITTDTDVEARLLGFGPEVVAPILRSRLIATAGATRPVDGEKLIEFGKKLVAGWGGYAVGAPEADRVAALDRLLALAGAAPAVTTKPAP